MLLTIITSDQAQHQRPTTQRPPKKGEQREQEKEVSLSGDGAIDSLLTMIMLETANNMSNNNEQEGTTDSVKNGTKSAPSQSTPKCSAVPNKATSFAAKVMVHKHCSSVDEDHGMWCMCEACGSVPVRSRCTFTNGRCYQHLESESHKRNSGGCDHLENKKSAAMANDCSISEKEFLQL